MANFDVEKAISLYKDGLGWRGIARKLGVHPFSIQSMLNRLGYESKHPVGGVKKINDQEVYDLKDDGYTHKDISEILKISESAIQKILAKRRKSENHN
jgi:DNA-binding transcriptional regulator LsrR (DeoR family)